MGVKGEKGPSDGGRGVVSIAQSCHPRCKHTVVFSPTSFPSMLKVV